jgi:hypothetical protein
LNVIPFAQTGALQCSMIVVGTGMLEGLLMPQYRIYTVNTGGHISSPAEIVICDDDQEAIQKAQKAVNGSAIELWDHSRLVVRFPADPSG